MSAEVLAAGTVQIVGGVALAPLLLGGGLAICLMGLAASLLGVSA